MSVEGAGEMEPEPERTATPRIPDRLMVRNDAGAPRMAPSDVLEAAHEARLIQAGQMLAGIVHEIRNPLAVIQGYAQLLQESLADADATEDVGRIIQETKRLGALVDDMLSLVRRDGGQRESSIDLARSVQAALNLTTHAMRQAAVTVVSDVPDNGCYVKGQQGACMQVLLNLLDNARESLEESGKKDREISIHIEEGRWEAERGEYWRVDVSNNGPPIPSKVADTIFDSFFTTKQARAGTGLGLALCREILERFGGSICLLDPGHGDRGVVFRLELPKA
ncbi:MAG: HAMP domain-containing sensor histidine kinase [Planctomycetota bacterium]|jgi:two-component system, NtrC family, sensor kinase|nr:HAMP domain-containing sensor histidine kinase [Planctomycetota bacterium]